MNFIRFLKKKYSNLHKLFQEKVEKGAFSSSFDEGSLYQCCELWRAKKYETGTDSNSCPLSLISRVPGVVVIGVLELEYYSGHSSLRGQLLFTQVGFFWTHMSNNRFLTSWKPVLWWWLLLFCFVFSKLYEGLKHTKRCGRAPVSLSQFIPNS